MPKDEPRYPRAKRHCCRAEHLRSRRKALSAGEKILRFFFDLLDTKPRGSRRSALLGQNLLRYQNIHLISDTKIPVSGTPETDTMSPQRLAGVVGIEPTSKVLETPILPLNHTPKGHRASEKSSEAAMVRQQGLEPRTDRL